jgi:hypothetical protein
MNCARFWTPLNKKKHPRLFRKTKMGTFVQNVHNFLIRSSTSGFCPDATNRVTQELVTPKYRATADNFCGDNKNMGSGLDQ